MASLNLYLVIILISMCGIRFGDCITPASLDKTYLKGIKAYSDERWSLCIEKFEGALHLYKLYKSVVINCRIKCNSQVYESQVKEDIDDLRIFEKYFNKRDCLNKCQDKEFANLNLNKTLDESILHDMQSKKPYEYLHVCYFQQRMFQKAVSAAYTYLVANPNDETMQSNVKYYIEQPEIDVNDIMDMESEDYVIMYNLGKKSYNQENWAETAVNMEEVLKGYFVSENNCRVECERQPGQEWSSEFVITMSNNMASLLHCRQQCQDKLRPLKYNSGVEFIADVLNYLQVAYYHLEKLEDAARAVASYLALMPEDEDMLENIKFYSKQVKEDIDDLRIFEKYFNKRDCLNKCQDKEFANLNLNKTLDESILHDMQSKKPYEYLHVCYFQQRMFQKAVSAAYTYLVANPNDETMQSNVKYYIEQPEIDVNDIMDMESEDYVIMYNLGKKSYNQENWAETAVNMEEVLKGYFVSENNCRVECERQPGQEWSSEFVITMSNNMASLLHCRQQCQDKLRPLKYNSGVEFIADVLNYLQVAYYHLEKLEDAARAVASYLALMPEDEDMLENIKFYSKQVDKKAFVPRSEIVHYLKRDTYEKNMLTFFHQGHKHDIDFDSILNSYNFLK
uniref:Leprecan-like alpha-helical domain-containing protein n=1 Tax=Heliothis virescens TaxID=7102 RepID=A0A2A4K065_HELVI